MGSVVGENKIQGLLRRGEERRTYVMRIVFTVLIIWPFCNCLSLNCMYRGGLLSFLRDFLACNFF